MQKSWYVPHFKMDAVKDRFASSLQNTQPHRSLSLWGGCQADVEIFRCRLSQNTVFPNLVLGNCHVRASPFLPMTWLWVVIAPFDMLCKTIIFVISIVYPFAKEFARHLTFSRSWSTIFPRPGRTAADAGRKAADEESPGSTGQG